MSRINTLLDSLLGTLVSIKASTQPAPAGKAASVGVADSKFGDRLSGRAGKFAVPDVGVAFAGDEKAGAMETGRVRHAARARFVVIIAVRVMAGTDAEQTAIFELIDAIVDAAAGVTPIARTREGAPILDDDDNEQPLGAPWAYGGCAPLDGTKEAMAQGLRSWALSFTCDHAFVPTTASAGDDDEMEGIGGTMDARPGADPASEDEDLVEFEIDV